MRLYTLFQNLKGNACNHPDRLVCTYLVVQKKARFSFGVSGYFTISFTDDYGYSHDERISFLLMVRRWANK